MKRADFIDSVSQKTGLARKEASAAVDAVLETIEESLSKGDGVNFIGFGAFSVSQRAARKAKVPGTDKVVDVPATKTVKFKVGKQLKDSVAKS